jgi:hypothetical protein
MRSTILALVVLCASAYDSWTCLPHTPFFGLRILDSPNIAQDTAKIYSIVSDGIISGAKSGEISPNFMWETSPSGIVSVWSS